MTVLRPPRKLAQSLVLLLVALTASCSSLPRSGPSTDEIQDLSKPENNPLDIRLVKLSPDVVREVEQIPRSTLGAIERISSRRPVDTIGPGDILSISIYEAGPGLFNGSPRPTTEGQTGSSAENLPKVQVDRAGRIELPFAGTIPVAGKTTTEVQKLIADRLAEKAVEPQVIVTLVAGDTNSVIVSGDVKNPGRRQLTLAGENLLDIIALSGGAAHDPADTLVKVTRGKVSAELALSTIQVSPAENVRMQPQDRIQVTFAPRSYLVFGATGRVAQMPLERERVTLAEAMARVGGLDDNRANPSSVYLFRFETPQVATLLHLPPPTKPGKLPVIYQADMRDPQMIFLAQEFATQDKDVLYVANAGTVQLYKFLQLLYTIVTPAVTGRQLSQ
jgi:polysaccharide export outer membrane protein